jgi:hypothetical protein
MTPEGHALSAWITFSALRDGETTFAQIQALERTADPFIELSYLLGANRYNDRFWEGTLENLARAMRCSRRGLGNPPRRNATTEGSDCSTSAQRRCFLGRSEGGL